MASALTPTERAEAKRAICAGFGVTPEEIDALDHHMRGPQERTARAQAEADLMANVDGLTKDMGQTLSTVLGVPVTIVYVDA